MTESSFRVGKPPSFFFFRRFGPSVIVLGNSFDLNSVDRLFISSLWKKQNKKFRGVVEDRGDKVTTGLSLGACLKQSHRNLVASRCVNLFIFYILIDIWMGR